MPLLTILSLSDLRSIQEIAFDFSIDREMYLQHDFWCDVQNQVEAEIKSRVVGIFGEPKIKEA